MKRNNEVFLQMGFFLSLTLLFFVSREDFRSAGRKGWFFRHSFRHSTAPFDP
jgi:hypothetical protein